MKQNKTPWDIYVDESKRSPRRLGFLVVPNSASFMHRLWKCRTNHGITCNREIHWNDPSMDTLHVCTRWIDEVFRFKGVKFCLLPWLVTQSKQSIIINFIDKLCQAKRSKPPHNMVMFLDFDTEHSKFNIQNHIREVANIARCYHLDSKNNDCIQCCDMLMNASERIAVEPTLRFEFNTLQEKLTSENRLKDSEVKKYLAGYLGLKIDTKSKKIYDLCRK